MFFIEMNNQTTADFMHIIYSLYLYYKFRTQVNGTWIILIIESDTTSIGLGSLI